MHALLRLRPLGMERTDRSGFTSMRGNIRFSLRKDDVIRHAEWLRGMKEQFIERKKELKAVVKQYLGVGTFIKPKQQQ